MLFVNWGLVTGVIKFHKKVSTSPRCGFCEQGNQTYNHLYWDCLIVQDLWRELFDTLDAWAVLKNMGSMEVYFCKDKIMLGLFPKEYTDPFIVTTIVKQYIYARMVAGKFLSFRQLWYKILWHRDIEALIYKKWKKIGLYKTKWNLLLDAR